MAYVRGVRIVEVETDDVLYSNMFVGSNYEFKQIKAIYVSIDGKYELVTSKILVVKDGIWYNAKTKEPVSEIEKGSYSMLITDTMYSTPLTQTDYDRMFI